MADGPAGELLKDDRGGEGPAVEDGEDAEEEASQKINAFVCEDDAEVGGGVGALGRVGGGLGESGGEPGALRRGEPGGVCGGVGEVEVEEEAEGYGWEAFYQEEPLPAGEREAAVEAEEGSGEGAHDRRGERQGDVEAADGAGAVLGWEPLREVIDDAGEEASLCHAEEEAHGVELRRGADEEHADGDDSPGEHDAGQPAAGTEADEEEVRRDLAEGVAEEEDACAEAVHGGGEVEVAVHEGGGEADVDAIHVRGTVAEGDERDEAAGGLAEGRCSYLCRSRLGGKLCGLH